MSKPSDLIRFLIDKNISIKEAMAILEKAENILKNKAKEKAIIKDYEKRGG